ncbi:MAG: hypothetical protein ACJARQ_000916 [Oleispira sp.]|jgi:hypothetical protein
MTPVKAPPPLKIGIFFDGTGNNDDNSNTYSNVKYLYDMHLGVDEKLKQKKYTERKFYQRGVGSHEDDSDFESAMGVGAKKRFENVIFHIEQYIAEYRDKGFDGKYLPPTIKLDVFGFSRGAAMARHFVNCIKQNYFDFKDPDINKQFSNYNININFLGVFDTVGSFGLAGDNIDTGYSFYIDPNWIEKKAVHIYALHEYRWGFDLQAMMEQQDTNYPIDIADEKLIELGLPGAHSDIGGGYEMNNLEQFCDNSLIACIALEKMAQYARESDVPLGTDYKDASRRSVTTDNKNFNHMKSSYTNIQPYLENNALRSPLGLWREQIALKDIYQHKREKTLPSTKLAGHAGASAKIRLNNIENTIEIIDDKIKLSEQQILELFSSEQALFSFKDNYRTLYLNYMHRSHSPFNSTFAMGKQDADENFWLWNKTISDERPHRDIFYNQYKDFEKNNRPRAWSGSSKINEPEIFKVLESIKWEDETRG